MEIGPLVLENKIYECFLPYMSERGGHLGHMIKIPQTKFHSPYPWMLHTNLAFIGQAVSEKKIFEIVDDGRTDDGRTDAGLIGIL